MKKLLFVIPVICLWSGPYIINSMGYESLMVTEWWGFPAYITWALSIGVSLFYAFIVND